jgi:heme-degrading monooxygenase HmoA
VVITIVTAKVAADKEAILKEAYEQAGGDQLPPFIRETFLLHEDGTDLWRIATVWNSREELEDYRRGVDTPPAIATFRAAGAEPTLTINEVAIHRTH